MTGIRTVWKLHGSQLNPLISPQTPLLCKFSNSVIIHQNMNMYNTYIPVANKLDCSTENKNTKKSVKSCIYITNPAGITFHSSASESDKQVSGSLS